MKKSSTTLARSTALIFSSTTSCGWLTRTRRDWIADGLDSLRDSARSGAPKKITPEQLAKIVDAATAEPLTARELLARHLDDGGAKIHIRTLRAALHSSGMVWKRTRHSLKKKECDCFQGGAGGDRQAQRSSGSGRDRACLR